MRNGFAEAVVASPFLHLGTTKMAAYLQALFEHSPLATVVLDAEHRFVICNPAFEELFQFRRDELARSDLDDLISGPETAREAHRLSRLVLQRQKVHTIARRRRKDGFVLDVEIHGIPLIVDGALSGAYGLYQDVTARNQAQSAFRRLTALADDLRRSELAQAAPLASRSSARSQPAKPATPGSTRSSEPLTARECEVLRLLVEGTTSRSIADRLAISIRTVESHRIRIHRKLGVGSVAELVRCAIRLGIVAAH